MVFLTHYTMDYSSDDGSYHDNVLDVAKILISRGVLDSLSNLLYEDSSTIVLALEIFGNVYQIDDAPLEYKIMQIDNYVTRLIDLIMTETRDRILSQCLINLKNIFCSKNADIKSTFADNTILVTQVFELATLNIFNRIGRISVDCLLQIFNNCEDEYAYELVKDKPREFVIAVLSLIGDLYESSKEKMRYDRTQFNFCVSALLQILVIFF